MQNIAWMLLNHQCISKAPIIALILHHYLNVFYGKDIQQKVLIASFDLYCPPIKGKLSKGICKTCNQYWPSEAAMLRHKKAHKMKFTEKS